MPIWGTSFISPTGEDYVASRAAGIAARQGRGLYAADPEGPAGQWRDLWAIPLAYVNAIADWFVWNANPGTAEDRLPEWEDLLLCSRRKRTIADRQTAAADKLRRAVHNDPSTIGVDIRENRLLSQVQRLVTESGVGGAAGIANVANAVTLSLPMAIAAPQYGQYLEEIELLMVQYLPAWTYYSIAYV